MAEKKKSGGRKIAVKRYPELPEKLQESYIMTSSSRNIGIYGERFLDAIIEAKRREQAGIVPEVDENGVSDLVLTTADDGGHYITISMKRLMAHNLDRNYEFAEEALRRLESVFFETKQDGIWKSRALITDPTIDENRHIGRFRIPDDIWSLIEDRSRGYREFSPIVGHILSSDTSYRLYKMMCNQERPLSYSIAEIRRILQLEDQYKRTSDFINRVIEPAKEDLRKNAEWFFDYELFVSKEEANSGKRGRPSYDMIRFFPKHNVTREVDPLKTIANQYYQGDMSRLLPDNLAAHLRNKYAFSDKEITNSNVFPYAYDIMKKNGESLFAFILDNTLYIDKAREKKAYLVKMVQKHIYERYGIALGSDKARAELTASGSRRTSAEKHTGGVSTISDLLDTK